MTDGSIDRFDRLQLLGEGGSGRVWLVRDLRQGGQLVALKELATPSPDHESAFRQEFATLKSIRHPNLVDVYEFGLEPGSDRPRFTLEYVEGSDLVSYTQSRGSDKILSLLAETLRALAFLHDFGLIHRDLKPANILVRKHARAGAHVVLLDFGLAISGRLAARNTSPAGTLPFLAPELLDGSPPSIRSDLYSLGAVVYEASVGKPIVDLDADGVNGLVLNARQSRALPLSNLKPHGLGTWIEHLTALDPSDRPATASEALAALNAACGTTFEPETTLTRTARLASGAPPGREAELAVLREWLSASAEPRVMLLSGESGSGKSRILRWLSAESVRIGKTVTTLTESTDSHESLDRQSVLLVDDPEVMGPRASETVARIAEYPERFVGKAVVAFRLRGTLSAGVKQLVEAADWTPSVAHLDLQPLRLQSVEAVLSRFTGRDEHGSRQAAWLHQVSEGIPLVLESLLLDHAWESRSTLKKHPTIENAFATRIEALSRPSRNWLDALAVLGTAGNSELEQVGEVTHEEAIHAAQEAELAGLAVRVGDQWAPVSGVLTRFVLRSLSRDRSVSLHSRAAKFLESKGDRSDDGGRLAVLWRNAGERVRSKELALFRAERLMKEGQANSAADWYRFAIALIPRRAPERGEIRGKLAHAIELAGRHAEAVRAFGALLRHARDTDERANFLSSQGFALMRCGRSARAEIVAKRALTLATRPGTAARARNILGTVLISMDRYSEALPMFLESAEQFAQVNDRPSRAQSLQLAGLSATNLRSFEQARGFLESALEVALESRSHDTTVNTMLTLGILERRCWNLVRAQEYYDRASSVIKDHRLESRLPIWLSSVAHVQMERGLYDAALAILDEAIVVAKRTEDRSRLINAGTARADVLIRVGRPNQAIEELTELRRRLKSHFEPKAESYLCFTMAEAHIETRHPDTNKVRALLAEGVSLSPAEPRVVLGGKIGDLECRLLSDNPQTFDDAWREYQRLVDSNRVALEPPMEVRALLARAQSLLQREQAIEALATAREAAQLGESKDLPALAARAHEMIASAQRLAGDSATALRSLDRARELLDEAASRINDEELRRGFLDRPVFRGIRRAGQAGATSGEQRLLAIYDMIRALNSETDPEELLRAMLDMALDVVRAERGLILLRDGESQEYTVRLARNLEKQTIEDAAEFSRNVVLRAGAGKAVLAVDTDKDDRLRDLKSVTVFGIRSVLCVPLRSRTRIVGAVYLDNRREGALFTPDDLRFLEAFADHAALALENVRIRRDLELENRRLRVAAHERARFDNIVGRSDSMQQVFDLIEKTAESRLPVLVLGESGTGKELVARAIHAHGPRRDKPFLSENCAAIPEALLESELFGHVKGAFTGAERDRRGLFEQAHGGTLFLDEIGDMPPTMQARLLRVLQEGEVRRVGGESTIQVDVRVLAATHRELQEEVRAGRLREDLYYRLQVLVIHIPALRTRFGDIPLLVEHFLQRISRERGREVPKLHHDVLDLLERYSWPGNVRQLENHIQRLALLAGDGAITLDVVRSDRGLRETLLEGPRGPLGPVQPLDRGEEQLIREALVATKGNRARAARMLGISRSTIFRKLKEYGLDRS